MLEYNQFACMSSRSRDRNASFLDRFIKQAWLHACHPVRGIVTTMTDSLPTRNIDLHACHPVRGIVTQIHGFSLLFLFLHACHPVRGIVTQRQITLSSTIFSFACMSSRSRDRNTRSWCILIAYIALHACHPVRGIVTTGSDDESLDYLVCMHVIPFAGS